MTARIRRIFKLIKYLDPISQVLMRELKEEIKRLEKQKSECLDRIATMKVEHTEELKRVEISSFNAGFNRGTKEGAPGDILTMQKSALGLISEREQEITKEAVIPA